MARQALIKLEKNRKITEKEYFKTGETVLEILPFEYGIKHLMMRLGSPDGNRMEIIGINFHYFMKPIVEKIRSYKYVYFEYADSDEDYVITLNIR